MKQTEVKLVIDTSGLDQVQASMHSTELAMQEFCNQQKKIEDMLEAFFEELYQKISADVRTIVRQEVKATIEKVVKEKLSS